MQVSYLTKELPLTYTEVSDAFGLHSLAYFCSTCGDVWGRVITAASWSVINAPCSRHAPTGVADWGHVPGSMLLYSIRKDDLARWAWGVAIETMPAAVLHKELEAHLNYVERKLHESETAEV
jgi:hypothetical protein